MDEILNLYNKISEELIKNYNDCEIIIIVKDGKVRLIEKGKEIKHLTNLNFSAGIGEVSEITITKRVI